MNGLGNKQIMANNIRRYMKIANVTSTDICTVLHIPMPTFSDWINAKTYPRIDKIEMLANYFGVSKADLVEVAPITSTISNGQLINFVRIASRDGSYTERRLTDEQVDALRAIVDQFPDAGDDL